MHLALASSFRKYSSFQDIMPKVIARPSSFRALLSSLLPPKLRAPANELRSSSSSLLPHKTTATKPQPNIITTMSDSPDEQKIEEQEAIRPAAATATVPASSPTSAAAQGLIHAMLHQEEQRLQSQVVHKQQDLAARTEQKYNQRRVQRGDDPTRGEKGPGCAINSQHAQRGSHGLSGQGPE